MTIMQNRQHRHFLSSVRIDYGDSLVFIVEVVDH